MRIPLHTFNLKVDYLVTEASLRVLFSEFGDVVDVTLKKSSVEEVRSTAVVVLAYDDYVINL
jgi:hypothetical protein